VTLIGTGGAGKSRLAVEVATNARNEWPDGIWWIELAAADDVTGKLIATFELPGQGPALRVVSAWLAPQRALIILDNCEHLVDACALVCRELLERCPSLTIIATSREPLGVSGEARWPLGSLTDSDAAELFKARARLVRPNFDPQPESQTIAEICLRLDQLPLAIEMAAARMDMMSSSELLANLKDRFRVLATGDRVAPERQQTMSATIDWSHRLLTQDEARLFRRLAVFHGGFGLDAVQAVCAASGDDDVLAALTRLVQKSMVVAEPASEGSRYRLLESHRAYAANKLREAGELDPTSERHYRFYKEWAATSAPAVAKARESANLWAAIGWAHEHADDLGLELATEVAAFEYSDYARARTVLLQLLGRTKTQGPARVRALDLAARLTSRQGDKVESRSLADASVTAARRLKDPMLVARALSGAGVVYHAAHDLAKARKMYDEALDLLRDSTDRRLAIEVQNQSAVLAGELGHFKESIELLRECLAFSRAAGDEATTARYLESEANARLGLGEVDAAARNWRAALATFRALDDPFGAIWCIGGLALTAAAQSDFERALRLAAIVDRMSREWSLSAWPSRLKELDDARRMALERLSARRADRVWEDAQAMRSDHAVAYALEEDRPEPSATSGLLSRRELEVVRLLAAGMTNKQIAAKLFLSERTAEGHVERIRGKLGVRSRTEVATWAVAEGLASADLDRGQPGSTV